MRSMPSKIERDTTKGAATVEDGGLDEILARIGARIRELRRLQGLTLVVMSEFTGIDQPTLSNIEAGKYNLTIKTANRVARALGVHLHELFIPREQSGIRAKPKRRKADGGDASQ
jgi:transcriptional regulator with XRE-family HTH domain